MQASGFSLAFSVLGFSYLAGMILMTFAREPRTKLPPLLTTDVEVD